VSRWEADRDRRVGSIETQKVVVISIFQVRERGRDDLIASAVPTLYSHTIKPTLRVTEFVAVR